MNNFIANSGRYEKTNDKGDACKKTPTWIRTFLIQISNILRSQTHVEWTCSPVEDGRFCEDKDEQETSIEMTTIERIPRQRAGSQSLAKSTDKKDTEFRQKLLKD